MDIAYGRSSIAIYIENDEILGKYIEMVKTLNCITN